MHFIRRLFGVVFGIAGAAGTLICFAGLIGCWLVYAEAVRRTDRAFGRVEGSLAEVSGKTSEVCDQLGRTRLELDSFRQREIDVAATPPAERSRKRAASRKLVESASPEIGEARGKLLQATEAALVVNGFLEALADISFGERVGVDTDQLRDSSDRLSELIGKAEKLSDVLARASPDSPVDDAVNQSTLLASTLDKVIQALKTGSTRMDEANERVENWHARVKHWLIVAALAITAVLVWIGLGQVSLLIHGRSMVRNP
jgi:hypothetical protein